MPAYIILPMYINRIFLIQPSPDSYRQLANSSVFLLLCKEVCFWLLQYTIFDTSLPFFFFSSFPQWTMSCVNSLVHILSYFSTFTHIYEYSCLPLLIISTNIGRCIRYSNKCHVMPTFLHPAVLIHNTWDDPSKWTTYSPINYFYWFHNIYQCNNKHPCM